MNLPALLISDDDAAAAVLTPVLSAFASPVVRCGHSEAANRLTQEKYAVVVVDFDDSLRSSRILREAQKASASLILRHAQEAIQGHHAITVALLPDCKRVRDILGAGAHFVLYKPISGEKAKSSLRAAVALFKRERRQSNRIPVQVPVQLTVGREPAIEAILLDLSTEGLDVVAPRPIAPTAAVSVHFVLPNSEIAVDIGGDVVWANPNGDTGVRFTEVGVDMRQAIKDWLANNQRPIPPPEPEESIEGKLTDLSLGACYVETESPFPEGSAITLCLKADEVEAEAEGIVRVLHPAAGMGVEFLGKTVEERAQVANFIGFLTASPGVTPELFVSPRALVAAEPSLSNERAESMFFAEMDDPLLNLLQDPNRLTQEEFMQELRSQRSAAE